MEAKPFRRLQFVLVESRRLSTLFHSLQPPTGLPAAALLEAPYSLLSVAIDAVSGKFIEIHEEEDGAIDGKPLSTSNPFRQKRCSLSTLTWVPFGENQSLRGSIRSYGRAV